MNIRQATYADKPAIFEFLKRAYAGRSEYKFPERWEWAYQDNPYLEPGAPPVWIAIAEDGGVIGQSAALVEPLVVEGKAFRVGWGVDFHVLPEHRGQGIGTRLQAANNEGSELFMSLSMAASAARIKDRLGLLPLPPVTEYSRILHHETESVEATLKRRFPWLPPRAARWAASVAAPRLTRRNAPPARREIPPGIEIRRETGFTETFDRLWERLAPAYRALVRRDARYLSWKYRRQPHMQHEIFGAYRSGELSGYLITRRARPPERNVGVLVDLFAHPQDGELAGALLAHALRRFFEQEVTFASAATGVPAFGRQLTALGFQPQKNVVPMARAPRSLPDSGWLLGKGDHDWDQFPLA